MNAARAGYRAAEPAWFIQTPSRTFGPIRENLIHSMLERHMIFGSDLVSQNRSDWEPLSQVPQLVPVSLLTIYPVEEKKQTGYNTEAILGLAIVFASVAIGWILGWVIG